MTMGLIASKQQQPPSNMCHVCTESRLLGVDKFKMCTITKIPREEAEKIAAHFNAGDGRHRGWVSVTGASWWERWKPGFIWGEIYQDSDVPLTHYKWSTNRKKQIDDAIAHAQIVRARNESNGQCS
jgi:hypothetical protein